MFSKRQSPSQEFFKFVEEAGYSWSSCAYGRGRASEKGQAYLISPGGQSRGLVLWVHGVGNDSLYPHRTIFAQILAQGFSIFTFDLDGHGTLGTTRFIPGDLAGCIPDALSQIPASSREHLHLVGHSLGGALVADYLCTHQPAVRSATIISTPFQARWAPAVLLPEVRALISPDFYRQAGIYGFPDILPAFGSFRRKEFPLRLGDGVSLGELPQLLRDLFIRLDLKKRISQIQVPVLLCYGGLDRIAPLSQGQEAARLIPDAKLLTVEKGTHFTSLLSEKTEKGVVSPPKWEGAPIGIVGDF